MEIPLRRKYLQVTHGRFRSPSNTSGITRPRMEKSAADKARAADDRKRSVWMMVLLANGKRRMRAPKDQS